MRASSKSSRKRRNSRNREDVEKRYGSGSEGRGVRDGEIGGKERGDQKKRSEEKGVTGREENASLSLTLVLGSAPHSSRNPRHLACLPVGWRQWKRADSPLLSFTEIRG